MSWLSVSARLVQEDLDAMRVTPTTSRSDGSSSDAEALQNASGRRGHPKLLISQAVLVRVVYDCYLTHPSRKPCEALNS